MVIFPKVLSIKYLLQELGKKGVEFKVEESLYGTHPIVLLRAVAGPGL